MQVFIDTGILLRLVDGLAPEHIPIRQTLQALRQGNNELFINSQVVAEFWNVSTRPTSARGGYGRTIEQTDRSVRFFKKYASILPDVTVAFWEWRRLVIQYRVTGVAVHDARLVAAMKLAGIRHILTLNKRDFERYGEITALEFGDLKC